MSGSATLNPKPTILGIGVCPGTRLGPAYLIAPPLGPDPDEAPASPADAERIREAFQSVAQRLDQQAQEKTGQFAEILQMTAQLARDRGFIKSSVKKATTGLGPTQAVAAAAADYAEMLRQLGGYMAERVTDLDSVRDRVICELRGEPEPGIPAMPQPGVLVATDLSPAQTAQLDLDKVLGIVTEKGGPTSHTAILAATLNIPAVVTATGAETIQVGDQVLLSGRSGEVFVNPDPDFAARMLENARRQEVALANSSGPGRTKDGIEIALKVNIGTLADAQRIAQNPQTESGIAGVGLLRTEFMFLDRPQAPDQDEQRENFVGIVRAFAGKTVTVRTLDIGADKPVPFIDQSDEENPALGNRGIRLARQHLELLDTQLAALAEVADANTRVMAPMVTTRAEAQWFARLARDKGLSQVGIMIETPAAALRAAQLMTELDFVSIGTNDLTQYVMAADRLNPALTALNDPWQPAVLDLIDQVCRAGKATHTEVGVCGEAGGDPLLALVLVGLGVASLSMSVPKVAAVRVALSRHTLEECHEMARAALAADSPQAARQAVHVLAGETAVLVG